MRISIIATVLNEERSIHEMLDTLVAQTLQPDEVVFVDGGSRDRTIEVIHSYSDRLPVKVFTDPGCNISRGRNRAIKEATGEIIASTDAGVRLVPNWLEDLTRPLREAMVDGTGTPYSVVSGFFIADPRTIFETAMGATVLPAIDEIKPATFLPSSRSVTFLKTAWEKVGGYPDWLDYSEDLIFDFDLRNAGYRFAWAPTAIAHFRPRSSLRSFYKQYYQYARGDGKANLWLKRHVIRYCTYSFGPLMFFAGFRLPPLWLLILIGAALYLKRPYQRLVPMIKGRPLFEQIEAFFWVPIIRVTGDIAKIMGYPIGVIWRLKNRSSDR